MSDGIREIYNEGRVVGLSAYEMYVRKLIERDPEADIPDEGTWLANMFGNGSAMILKVPNGTTAGFQDFALPINSTLCGCNTILASVFNGDCSWNGNWATSVVSYGGLIDNTSGESGHHPTSNNIPHKDSPFDNNTARENIVNYCKIVDGVILQQGNWEPSTSAEPKAYDDLVLPDFIYPATVRLYINSTLDSDVKILLLGFMDSGMLPEGVFGGSTNPETNGADNGAFLGSARFPWASKIVFIYPNIANLYADQYKRKLPSDADITSPVGSYHFDGQESELNNTSIIDLDTTNPQEYYTTNASKYSVSPTIPMNVELAETTKDGFNILSVLEPGMTGVEANAASHILDPDSRFFPPALYAAKVTRTGSQEMVPVDTAAPGTVKAFMNETEAENYTAQLPNNFALYINSQSGEIKVYYGGQPTPINISIDLDVNKPVLTITSANKTVKTLALSDDEGYDYDTDGSYGSIDVDPDGISWDNILEALEDNKLLDVLGSELRTYLNNLPDFTVPGTITDGEGRTFTDYVSRRIITDTLYEGDTSITIPTGSTGEPTFTETGFYDIYTSKWGVSPKTITPMDGFVTLTFDAQDENIEIGVRCFENLEDN